MKLETKWISTENINGVFITKAHAYIEDAKTKNKSLCGSSKIWDGINNIEFSELKQNSIDQSKYCKRCLSKFNKLKTE